MIVDELIYEALDRAGHRKIKDVRVGLGYTCVMLEDDNCGLALTFREDLGDCCGVLNVAGGLIGTGADTIIPWAKDNHRLKLVMKDTPMMEAPKEFAGGYREPLQISLDFEEIEYENLAVFDSR
jgi:hypothetical protein